ncbi:MAG: xylose isomerase [Bacteroides sp. SM23_62_1]|nr:MAG: xylose isomerase [Bacteroides sp. SM23_62_1]
MKTRRDFIKLSGAGMAGTALSRINPDIHLVSSLTEDTAIPFELGIASYTFRKFNLDDTLAMTRRLAIRNIAFKSFHLPLEATSEEITATTAKIEKADLNLYGCGVVYMNNESEVNQAFEYARMAGMKLIIGVPNHELLPMVEKKVKEYGIRVAIHNHGPGDEIYPTLESIYVKIKDLDPGIGMCHDIGHTQRYGEDPVKDTEKYFNRILDVHLKDVTESSANGKNYEVGRGVIDIPGVLDVLVEKKFTGFASFEYEKDEDDPLPGLAESVGYVRGVLKMISRSS